MVTSYTPPLSSLTSDTLAVLELLDAERGPQPAVLSRDEIDLATHRIDPSKARHEGYGLYHDYYQGRQRDPRGLRHTDADKDNARAFPSAHNICRPLVDIYSERLTVTGFSLTAPGGEKTAATDDLAALLWRWWQAARMDAFARVVHRHMFTFGDAFVMVQWDPHTSRPLYSVEDPRRITPVYDGDHNLTAVYKAWEEQSIGEGGVLTRVRINRYRPGLVEKFVSQNGLSYTYWTEDRDREGNADGGVIPMYDAAGLAIPIPIVHFRNQADVEDFGQSELTDFIALQDSYNRRVWATDQAAIFDGARIKYGVNIAAFVDPTTGTQRDPPLGPNAFWYLRPDDPAIQTEVGSLEPGNVTQLQEVAERELKTAAGLKRVPLHVFWPEGGLPSGESLKTAEGGLTALLGDRQVTAGNAWEDVQYLAIRLANVYGNAGLAEDALCTTEWAAVTTRSELADEQVIDLRKADLSWRQRMRERNYSEEEMDRIEAEREDEQPEPEPLTENGPQGPPDANLAAQMAEAMPEPPDAEPPQE